MSYSFTIDQNKEGVLNDGISPSIKQRYLVDLDWGNYQEAKEHALREEELPVFQQYIEQIYLKAVSISRKEPKLLFAYYVQCDYQLSNKNIKKAIECILQGVRVALSAIPKGHQGRLSRSNVNNIHFLMLADQLINVVQMFLIRNTQIDFDGMLDRVIEGEDVYDWYQKPLKLNNSLIGHIRATEKDFDAAINGFIQALTPLSRLVDGEGLVVDEILTVLHVMAGNTETAVQLNNALPMHFWKMFQKSALALIQKKHAEALYYFRKGMLMNRHFMSCLRLRGEEPVETYQFYEDLRDSSYDEARRYLKNCTGALWWKEEHEIFAEWASELSIVLEDRAALMREYERLQHLDDLTMPTTPIHDRVELGECELAVRKVRDIDDELVYPWSPISLEE